MSLSVKGLLEPKLITLVKSLQHEKQNAAAIITASMEGLKMTTDSHRTLQSHLYLPRSMFQTYQLQGSRRDASSQSDVDTGTLVIAVPLLELIELLELCRPLGKPSTKTIQDLGNYESTTNLFSLEWNEAFDHISFRMSDASLGSQIECKLSTLNPPSIPIIKFASDSNPIIFKLILTGKYLRELLSQFSDSKRLGIEADPELPAVVLTAEEHWGNVRVAISCESPNLETCQCNEPVHISFPASFVKPSGRALSISSKASLRINKLGALSLQIMVPLVTDTSFFEYILAPYVDT